MVEKISFRLGERGVSEVVSVILITVVMAVFCTSFLLLQSQQSGGEMWGISEMVSANEHRINQLLSLNYYNENRSTSKLNVYLFNYGTENVIIKNTYINQTQVSVISIRDAVTGNVLGSVPPRKFVELVFPLPAENTFYLTLESSWRAVYSWQISL